MGCWAGHDGAELLLPAAGHGAAQRGAHIGSGGRARGSGWGDIRQGLKACGAKEKIAGSALTKRGRARAGLVGLSLSYALPITGLLNGLLTSAAETEQEMVSVERMLEFSHIPPQVCPCADFSVSRCMKRWLSSACWSCPASRRRYVHWRTSMYPGLPTGAPMHVCWYESGENCACWSFPASRRRRVRVLDFSGSR